MPAVEAGEFERRYREDPDPWRYGSSPYERAKYDRTLAAIPGGRVGDGLELGCSNGTFSELLAPRCEHLLAIDFSPEAVRLAKRRTSRLADVTVERRDARAGLPPGRFDLIVCSEILYYWDRPDVEAFCASALRALGDRGCLIAVDWRGTDPEAPLDGPIVHGMLADALEPELIHTRSELHPSYLLDRWEAAA